MFPPNHESCWVKVLCGRTDYSASRLARAVEDCDAHLLNLNILATSPSADMVAVLLRVGMRHGQSVVRSLARYGYDSEVITDAEGKAQFTIDAAGEYLISARSDSAILVPPVCIVTVK